MMPTLMGASMPDSTCQMYSPQPSYDEYTRQLALAEAARRMSRNSSSYRSVNPMRIVKPSSASNSPQAMMARRRTLMNDGTLARRRRAAMDQIILQQLQGAAASTYESYREPVTQQSRPLSWHPGSQIQQPQFSHFQQPPQYDFYQYGLPTPSPYCEDDLYCGYPKFPPTPIAYSGQASPIANMSPMSLPYATPAQPQVQPRYVAADGWNDSADFEAAQYTAANAAETEPFPSYTGQSSFCWDSLATQDLNTCTTPPTPESFQPVSQQHETVIPSEESIPYQPLEEAEEEGEILVGMGLYDKPEETGSDPTLNNYMTTTSHLLGTAHMRGAGLKLEEAWEPPIKTGEEDGEEDAQGEEQ